MPQFRMKTVKSRALVGCISLSAALGSVAFFASAQENRNIVSNNLYGSPGLVDMPTAEALPDGTLTTTVAQLGETTRTSISFQISERLSASFRYSALAGYTGGWDNTYFDRSFDLRYQILTESQYRPSLTLGLQDVLGTGLYSGEYLVATKTLTPGLKVTGGFGWGRFGGNNPFATTGTRPDETLEEGGIPTVDRWFRGDVAAFGGVSYAPNDRWNFKLEYSSDIYEAEDERGQINYTSPWNFGVDYHFKNGNQMSIYHAYGDTLGAQFSIAVNPRTQGVPGGFETAGLPIKPRNPSDVRDLGWTTNPNASASAQAALTQLAAKDGLIVEGLTLEAHRATVRVVNPTYNVPSQAIGRLARSMSRSMPASVEEFVIIPIATGIPMSAIVLKRSDLERLEHEAATDMLVQTSVVDAYKLAPAPNPGIYPKFTWAITPYVDASVFDPDQPVRLDAGIRAKADYEITSNIILSGSITKKLLGNLDEDPRQDESGLPRVRTDNALYSAEGDPAIEYLQLAMYGRPASQFYSRVSVGYLERMYGGLSTEILWKPVGSRLALGAELNYIQRRDYNQLFGFQDMTTEDPVSGEEFEIPHLNGHVSAYYDMGKGFHGQLDVGRYLAGDYGATITLDKEFSNGWKVGAYATFTDVTSEEFGEGSFDKGLRFWIPLSPFIGQPSRKVNPTVIQSLSRDGGARLKVRGRLYEHVREYHEPEIAKSWGRFWR
ncbi:YjbH domain-containing protein [Pelagimonas varians]|uniref:Exopolysaccharide biosynthesis protein YbjH n=1 Tax=Pelagimonas varians TaxID=696760 RepID=A0A238L2N4_9RHOB|nr:YjbH domain-containing protein [Pelagimonas varians]PYG26533.1 exopolysaccharide biosynthesis protein YbjH [Pelagimonas varians]SMX49344.1 hypothetical protein PEV8663_04171 [Pelagimonas varians]